MTYPPIAMDLERLVGRQGLIALSREFGGVRLYIPQSDAHLARHRLAGIVGEDSLRRLSAEFGGCQIMVPLLTAEARWQRDSGIAARRAAGASAREIARETGLCMRSVQRATRRVRLGGTRKSHPAPPSRQRTLW